MEACFHHGIKIIIKVSHLTEFISTNSDFITDIFKLAFVREKNLN